MASFKAKLIHDKKFYAYQWYGFIIGFIGTILMGLFWGVSTDWFFEKPSRSELWIAVLLLVAWVPEVVIAIWANRKIVQTYGAKRFEINYSGIILGDRKIDVSELENVVTVDPENAIELEGSLRIIFRKLKGKTNPFFIKIKTKKGWERFDFMVESHYMVVQLKKVLKTWEEKGIDVKIETDYEEDVRNYQASEFSG